MDQHLIEHKQQEAAPVAEEWQPSALDFAPDVEMEVLQQIQMMEAGLPPQNGHIDDDIDMAQIQPPPQPSHNMKMNNGDAYIVGSEPDPEAADIINYSAYINGKVSSPPHQQACTKGSLLSAVPEEDCDLPADPFQDSSSSEDPDRRED